MTSLRKAILSVVLFCLTAAMAQAATWTTIDPPGSTATDVFGINSGGDLVGTYSDSSGMLHGFVLSGGAFTDVDVPNATYTVATSINDSRQIAGYFLSKYTVHAFFFDGQNFLTLDFPGARRTEAWGINNAAEIVGIYADNEQKIHGFKWSNGSFLSIDVPGTDNTYLAGINNLGHMVGYYFDFWRNSHAFVLNPKGGLRKLGGYMSATGINDHRVVVGYRVQYGFRYNLNNYAFNTLQFPQATTTRCYAINGIGQIVGSYYAGGVKHGFLRTK